MRRAYTQSTRTRGCPARLIFVCDLSGIELIDTRSIWTRADADSDSSDGSDEEKAAQSETSDKAEKETLLCRTRQAFFGELKIENGNGPDGLMAFPYSHGPRCNQSRQ